MLLFISNRFISATAAAAAVRIERALHACTQTQAPSHKALCCAPTTHDASCMHTTHTVCIHTHTQPQPSRCSGHAFKMHKQARRSSPVPSMKPKPDA